MMASLKNVVVVGGSYVGLAAVKELASALPETHRLLLVEPHSHFHHLFAFPRFAIVPDHEHKAFIPYSTAFASAANPSLHSVVRAKAVELQPRHVVLDRDWQGSKEIPFDYLVVATGTRLPAPGTMQHDEKAKSVDYLQQYQQGVKNAKSIVIVGGGAVGVQMATDLKEVYPEKDVTVVQSRDRLMPLYHPKMDEIIRARFKELGVNVISGTRAVVPPNGFPSDGNTFQVELKDGRTIPADLVIPATGQIPNNQFVKTLEPSTSTPILNPDNGFIKVRPTLQFQDPKYPYLYAIGDIADTGAHKAARPGAGQAQVAAKNIIAMIQGREPTENITVGPPGIHLTLGLEKNMLFRNPDTEAGETEPFIKMRNDGAKDMNIDSMWERRGVKVSRPEDYHL
ncbi:Oxidoreductase [Pleurostoma richardsiae]|uniref:Oxidoreductase n=1 Tax=Pleurostoma richardsiae TaxID=41990 RepID=A0AA38S0Y5_9PEZI|nr:Oxidoreductase [Pleurostoma richardsiae]